VGLLPNKLPQASSLVVHSLPPSSGSKVAAPLSNADLAHAQPSSIECILEGLGRVGVLNIRTGNGGVHKRDDAAEGLGGGEGGSGGNDLRVLTELGDNLVSKFKLEDVNDHVMTGKGRGLTLAQALAPARRTPGVLEPRPMEGSRKPWCESDGDEKEAAGRGASRHADQHGQPRLYLGESEPS